MHDAQLVTPYVASPARASTLHTPQAPIELSFVHVKTIMKRRIEVYLVQRDVLLGRRILLPVLKDLAIGLHIEDLEKVYSVRAGSILHRSLAA